MKLLLTIFITFISLNISISQIQWWTEQNSGVTTALTSVSVLGTSPANVWVCGYSGVVLRTTNSGNNWLNVSGTGIPSNIQLINICSIDGSTALVSGYLGTNTWIWKTTNAGANWTQVFTQPNGFIDGVVLRPNSATDAVAVGDPVGSRWAIFRTTNAGTTWDSSGMYLPQAGTESGYNNSVYWSKYSGTIGDSGLWFGTNNYRIYHSTNRGFNWIVQSIPGEQNIYAIGFLVN